MWNGIIDEYLYGTIDETDAKINYLVPWRKKIRKSLADANHILLDEVVAPNDVIFSTKVG